MLKYTKEVAAFSSSSCTLHSHPLALHWAYDDVFVLIDKRTRWLLLLGLHLEPILADIFGEQKSPDKKVMKNRLDPGCNSSSVCFLEAFC